MKKNPTKNLISKLNRIREEIKFLSDSDSQTAFLKSLDELILALSRLRTSVSSLVLREKLAEIQKPLDQVVDFLDFAKNDEALRILLSPAPKRAAPKPKRQPVDIPSNLTNEQIRSLLDKDLSKAELKAIAVQRSVSVGKSNAEEIRRNILKNLDRQEGYGRLGSH